MREHLKKARYNENFLEKLDELVPADYFDWKITVAFYVVVHYIDAYFESHGVRVNSHEKRRNAFDLAVCSLTEDCIDNYDNIYQLARTARYNGFKGVREWTKFQKENYQMAKENMNFIKNEITEDLAQIE